MTSTRSSVIKEKLGNLGMVEVIDYRLQDILQPVAQGGFTKIKSYFLNADSFKKCLMRAKRHAGQAVDPMIYCDYYILLERMYILYTFYQRTYDAKVIDNLKKTVEQKDEKIDRLEAKLDAQNAKLDKQSEQINDLLGYARNTKDQLTTANTKLDKQSEELATTHGKLDTTNNQLTTTNKKLDTTITKLESVQKSVQNIASVITTGFNMFTSFVKNNIFSSANKTHANESKKYLTLLGKNGKISKMKIQYLVAKKRRDDSYDVYMKCTNVDGIYTALKKIHDTTSSTIIGPFAIGLNLNEINSEIKTLKDLIPDIATTKKFRYEFDLEKLVERMRNAHLNNYEESNEIIKYIIEQDSAFNADLLKSIQHLLDMYVTNGHVYRPAKYYVDSALEEIMKYVERDFNDDNKIIKMIEENGEAVLRKQIEELSKSV
jgi:uncharacterized coiled-coil protein SlyX